MSISFQFRRGRLIVVPVRMRVREDLARRPLMALDTGARLSVITPRMAQELGVEQDGTEPTANITGAIGTGSAVVLRVRSVSILGEEIRDLRVLCHPLPEKLKVDGILGLNFLKDFNIEIMNETETVTLARWRE